MKAGVIKFIEMGKYNIWGYGFDVAKKRSYCLSLWGSEI